MAGIAQSNNPRAAERVSGAAAPLATTDRGGMRWFLPRCLHEALLGATGLRLDEWLEQGAATIVKQGPHRIVYRVQLDRITFFVKHNLAPDYKTWLRQWLRPSKARLEFNVARGVGERNIGAVIPLGFGETLSRFRSGESYLLTLALEDTQPLQEFLTRVVVLRRHGSHARLRQRLAVQLGAWVARLHDAGILHNDFHAGNILVRAGAEDSLEFFLVDLTAVRLGRPLNAQASRDNLVMLNRWFMVRSSRADRLRFWRSYAQTRQGPAGNRARFRLDAVDLERRTLESNLAFWRERDRRCLENNRYYRRLAAAGMYGHAVAELDAADLSALLANPDAPFAEPGVRLLKAARGSTVIELDMRLGGVTRRFIYKRFRLTHWHDPLRSLIRPSAALRSWVHGHGLCERGLPTPRPLAVFQRRRLGLTCEGYLITEKIEDAQNLNDFLRQMEALAPRERLRRIRREVAQMARILRTMHERRIGHRDLKAHNILVSRKPRPLSYPGSASTVCLLPNSLSSIWIIDLVGVQKEGRLHWTRKVQNLARLNVSFRHDPALSATDRLRFLREYMQWNLHGNDHWKKWWRAIAAATQAKIARNERRGRPVA